MCVSGAWSHSDDGAEQVDLLPEISKAPAMLSTYANALDKHPLFKAELDSYLRGRPNAVFLADLPAHLFLTSAGDIAAAGTRVNVPLINALVLYVASAAIAHNPQGPSKPPSAGGVSLDLFMKLSRDLETEARYLFLNALANQLRFPNAHTHFFSSSILALFQAAHDTEAAHDKEVVREQITRVLIERLIVYKPHPWGLLITFIELIKNPAYDLARHDFVRSSPEIEQL
ncbi:CCR4-Not complex component, partial [Baffinella frigidus]